MWAAGLLLARLWASSHLVVAGMGVSVAGSIPGAGFSGSRRSVRYRLKIDLKYYNEQPYTPHSRNRTQSMCSALLFTLPQPYASVLSRHGHHPEFRVYHFHVFLFIVSLKITDLLFSFASLHTLCLWNYKCTLL